MGTVTGEREHLEYLVVDKRIILKLSSLGYGKCKVNRQAERGGKNVGVTVPILEPGARKRWVLRIRPWPFCAGERDLVPITQSGVG